MKYLAVILGLVIAFVMGLLGIIHSRRTLEFQLTKTNYFENMKNKVSSDVLKESKNNVAEANKRLSQTRKRIQNLIIDFKVTQVYVDGTKAQANTCNEDLAQIMTEIDDLEVQKNQTSIDFQQNMDSMKKKINNLEIELERRSGLCNYIIKRSIAAMKLCGIVPVIQMPIKVEADYAAE